MVEFKQSLVDENERQITMKHQSYRGTDREIWLGLRETDLGPVINLAATGDMTPRTARRLANLLRVAADMAEPDIEEKEW